MRKIYLLLATVSLVLFASCGSTKLAVTDVSYQSVCNARKNLAEKIPDDATIAIFPIINEKGELSVVVKNLTDEVMVIDRTKSFVVNSDGVSSMYYDPTVKTTSSTNISSATSGAEVNLGAIGNAIGIGGALGAALNGVNVGGSSTSGSSVTNTTYTIDQPSASLAPYGQADMGRKFQIMGLGEHFLSKLSSQANYTDVFKPMILNQDTYCNFSVCISYSLDGGKTFDKIVSNYYTNSVMLSYVRDDGDVNTALRKIYKNKSDALTAPWYLLHFNVNDGIKSFNDVVGNMLYDYK